MTNSNTYIYEIRTEPDAVFARHATTLEDGESLVLEVPIVDGESEESIQTKIHKFMQSVKWDIKETKRRLRMQEALSDV